MPDHRPTGVQYATGWRSSVLLSLVPFALFVLPAALYPWTGPFFGTRYIDPSYHYLFNSLLVAIGESPPHIHHPGTPVQELGAGIIWLRAAVLGEGGNEQELVGSVLAQPEPYLRCLSAVLLAMMALVVWRLGHRLADTLGGTGYGLLGQAVLLSSPAVMSSLYIVSAEQLLLAVGLLLGISALPIAMAPAPAGHDRALIMGGLLGLGIAIKFTCLPLAALLLALRRWQSMLLAITAAAVVFVLATAPIWPRYGQLLDWLVGLAFHSGSYGAGEIGLPPLDKMLRDSVRMLIFEPIVPLTGTIGLAALAMLYRRRTADVANLGTILASSLLGIVVVVLLMLKHPMPRYLVPAIAVAAVLLPLALKVLLAGRERALSLLVPAILVVAVGAHVALVTKLLHARTHERKMHERLTAAADTLGCFLVPAVKSSMPLYALAAGNEYSCGRFAGELEAMYPRFVYYSLYQVTPCGPVFATSPGFTGWRGNISLDTVRSAAGGRAICLMSHYDLARETDLPVELTDLVTPREKTFHTEQLYIMGSP